MPETLFDVDAEPDVIADGLAQFKAALDLLAHTYWHLVGTTVGREIDHSMPAMRDALRRLESAVASHLNGVT